MCIWIPQAYASMCCIYTCTCMHAQYMHASHLHGMEDPSHAKFMLGRGHPCKVHAWKGRPMQSSCMEGETHARFMHGRGHPCKVHAWKGTSMQGSCMEGDIHARITHRMEDSLRPLHVPCMIHAFMHEICWNMHVSYVVFPAGSLRILGVHPTGKRTNSFV